ncbi:MAG TPA: hypothetical protein DDZ81_10105 [Acetobacteraceae bacterium]|jgi:hypothetical protein|nr:hypothetical protein [Acetobacteraceae bacterium]
MAIMTVHIPDDVKAAFDKAFEGEDKNAVVARLLLEAAEKRERGEPEGERREVSLREAIDAVIALRKQPPYVTDAEIKQAREEGRH